MTMVEVDVDTLIGPALDWVMATLEELPIRHDPMAFGNTANGGYWVWENRPGGQMLQIGPKPAGFSDKHYSPSTRWDQLGPLILQFPIMLGNHKSVADDGTFWGSAHCFQSGTAFETADGVMVASCRAIAAYKYGAVVAVPKALLP